MTAPFPHPQSARAGFADRAAIVGIGETEYTRHGGIVDRTEFALCCEAIKRAADDAGIDVKEIDGFASYAYERHEPVQIQSATGLVTIFFSSAPVRDYVGAQACDLEAYGAWCRALLDHGVYPPPSQFEAWFPSLAHTEEHVERTIEAARAAFAEL